MQPHPVLGDLGRRSADAEAAHETPQAGLYAQIRPAAVKQAVEFNEAKALDVVMRRENELHV